MDPNIVKQTQETLGKFITKPPLTEKLLNKPPFRFLHDLITEVIRTTNFLQGLYSDEEMDSKKVTTREGKIEFLQKAITCTSIVHGSALPAKPSKIVAGHDPENTNAFLQVMARCIRKSMSSEEAVKMVLTGEIPTKKDPSPKEKESTGGESARPSKKEHRSRDEKSSKHRSREEKEGGGEKDEKATKEEKDKRRRERSEKSREGGSEANKEKSRSREDREKSKPREDREKSKHREDREKSKHREDREKSKPREDGEKSKHREDREKSKPREDGEKSKHREDREKSKHREDREKSKHREREKSKHREEKENAPQGDEKGKSSKRSEDKDAEKEKRRQERKKRHEQKGEHVERPDGGKDEEKPKQLAKKEKIETPVKLADVDDKKSKDQEEENVAGASVRAQRPASAKGQRRRPQTRNSGRNEITTNETPATAVEPPAEAEAPAFGTRKLVRPPSARPSAPRVRRNAPSAADENLEASGQDKNATTIIVDRDENMTLSDEEDAEFVVQEDKTEEDPDLLPAALSAHSNGDLNSEEHGGLVRKILETKKELEGSASKQKLGRTEIQQSNVVTAQQQKEQQLVVQEIEQLRTSVQKLCQSSAPLAKLIDYSQEDMDAMQNELQMWKKENKEHGFKIKEDNNATALSIEPLKSELEELEQAIGVYRTQMAATKANIIRNEDKIHKMMIAVATRA